MMMTMAPEDRVLLRQKAELHRQEQLKALGVEDTLDPKFKPPMERKKEDAMKPRPFDVKLDSFHREGSMVLNSARNIGVLKDLTRYGATFMPLDLNMEQKEKAVLYIALRDAYQ